jgi:hypothetical protein
MGSYGCSGMNQLNRTRQDRTRQSSTGRMFLDGAKWECNLASLFIFVRITLITTEAEDNIRLMPIPLRSSCVFQINAFQVFFLVPSTNRSTAFWSCRGKIPSSLKISVQRVYEEPNWVYQQVVSTSSNNSQNLTHIPGGVFFSVNGSFNEFNT